MLYFTYESLYPHLCSLPHQVVVAIEIISSTRAKEGTIGHEKQFTDSDAWLRVHRQTPNLRPNYCTRAYSESEAPERRHCNGLRWTRREHIREIKLQANKYRCGS